MTPSTTTRATSSRSPIRASTTGSMRRVGLVGWREVMGGRRLSAESRGLHSRAGNGNQLEQFVDDHVARDALGLGVEVHEDTVAKNWLRECANVLEAHVRAAVHERARLAAEDEVLRRTDGGAVRCVLRDDL